jgi:hypothetical protein
MNKFGQIRAASIAFLLAIAIMTPQKSASAAWLAGNLGTGNSFNTSAGYALSGPHPASGSSENLAVEFSFTGTAPVLFSSAQLALQFHSGANQVTVALMSSTAGVPGTVLETMSLSVAGATATLYTVTSTVNTVLYANTNYWLAADVSGTSDMTWMENNQGQTNHLAFQTDSASTGLSAWTTAPGNPDIAYAVYSIPVPAPSSASLFGVGIVALAGYRIRRTRRDGRLSLV